MAKFIKKCKICGSEYEYCHTLRKHNSCRFYWQDVACSEEHGSQYLALILESRNEAPKTESISSHDYDMYDEDDDDEFDCDDFDSITYDS